MAGFNHREKGSGVEFREGRHFKVGGGDDGVQWGKWARISKTAFCHWRSHCGRGKVRARDKGIVVWAICSKCKTSEWMRWGVSGKRK